jgi:hypothetical protein
MLSLKLLHCGPLSWWQLIGNTNATASTTSLSTLSCCCYYRCSLGLYVTTLALLPSPFPALLGEVDASHHCRDHPQRFCNEPWLTPVRTTNTEDQLSIMNSPCVRS